MQRLKVEAVAKPEHIKPGLPYTAYVSNIWIIFVLIKHECVN